MERIALYNSILACRGTLRINKHHDFYQKIYQRASSSGYSVEGMDLLLWAFSAAEQNHTNADLEPGFEDLREEISINLRKLLRDIDLPSEDLDLELDEAENFSPDHASDD